jgi:hypothetical protein
MNGMTNGRGCFDNPASYRILVLGDLTPDWSDRLEGMSISVVSRRDDMPVTSLFGVVPDQNALAGVLVALVDLHLSILSVQRLFGNGSSSG